MKRLLLLAPKLNYVLYFDLWEAIHTKFICSFFTKQGHVSIDFRFGNFTYYK